MGSIPPADSNFWSHRKRFPHKVFQVSECVALSLSVFDEQSAAEKLRRLIPAMREKPIFQLDLNEKDGAIQQTSNDQNHYFVVEKHGFQFVRTQNPRRMKILLKVQETLVWHDEPQLFTAEDPIGGLQICLAVETADAMPYYIGVAISAQRLMALKMGKIDLRQVFDQPEMGAWFQVKISDDEQLLAEPLSETTALPEKWLPAAGEFLTNQPQEAAPLRSETFEAIKMEAVAKEAGMNPGLLRQYVAGIKRPSPEQTRRVQDAMHRLARRILEVRFV